MPPSTSSGRRDGGRPWPPGFALLNAAFLAVYASVAFLYLYPLALAEMGASHGEIGWVMGIFSLAAVAFRPVLGQCVGRYGEGAVALIGIGLALAATLAYFRMHAFGPALLVVRVVHGIGFSAFVAASFATAAKSISPARHGEAFSLIGAALLAAVALAPPLGEALVARLGFTALFGAAAASLGLAAISTRLSFRRLIPETGGSGSGRLSYRPLLRSRPFVRLLVSTWCLAHLQATVPNFLALLAEQQGVPSGPFFFSAHAAGIVVLLSVGRWIDRLGPGIFLRLAYPVFAGGIVLIPWLMSSVGLSIIPAVMYGAGIGMLFPVHNALAARQGARRDKPAVMSLFTMVYDSGFITGAILSGWIAQQTSLTTLFQSSGLIGALGFGVALGLRSSDGRGPGMP